MYVNCLLEFTFEINLFSLVAFIMGMISGAIVLVLAYAIGSINSLKKDRVFLQNTSSTFSLSIEEFQS